LSIGVAPLPFNLKKPYVYEKSHRLPAIRIKKITAQNGLAYETKLFAHSRHISPAFRENVFAGEGHVEFENSPA
jgi:hypothetical protein